MGLCLNTWSYLVTLGHTLFGEVVKPLGGLATVRTSGSVVGGCLG